MRPDLSSHPWDSTFPTWSAFAAAGVYCRVYSRTPSVQRKSVVVVRRRERGNNKRFIIYGIKSRTNSIGGWEGRGKRCLVFCAIKRFVLGRTANYTAARSTAFSGGTRVVRRWRTGGAKRRTLGQTSAEPSRHVDREKCVRERCKFLRWCVHDGRKQHR